MTETIDDESMEEHFLSRLRTKIILAARKSSSNDIEIDAIDRIVETTLDFVKNLLEQTIADTNSSTISSNDLLKSLRVRSMQNVRSSTKFLSF